MTLSLTPGLTDTDRTAEAHLISTTPMKRMAEPGEIASVVAFLLSERSSYIAGETILAAGGRG